MGHAVTRQSTETFFTYNHVPSPSTVSSFSPSVLEQKDLKLQFSFRTELKVNQVSLLLCLTKNPISKPYLVSSENYLPVTKFKREGQKVATLPKRPGISTPTDTTRHHL